MGSRYDDEEARYKGYGTPYLTPSQELSETMDLGQRGLQARVSANPLAQPDVVALPTASVAPEAIPAPVRNPLIAPPVPLAAMGTDQRIKWQQLEDDQRARQTEFDARGLDADIKRQGLELRAEQIRQNRELAAEIPKLREALNKSPEEYQDLKADLTQRFPIGMGSPESDRIFGEYEKIFTKTEGVKAQLNSAKIARQEAARQKQDDALLKEAGTHGGDVVREVAARLADPLKGSGDASEFLAGVQQKSAVQSLRDSGLSDQEIAQRYGTGKDFNYQAAKNAPKSALSLLRERKQARADLAAIEKARAESRFDPARATKAGKDPYANTTWTPELEQEREDARALVNELAPKIGDNRAGVAGMATKYVPYERTLNPAARAPAAAAQAPATAAPAVPREKTYRHPKTGERIALRNGKWEKI